MLALRVLSQLLAVALPLVAGALDYQWRDKRTRKFRYIKRGFFALAALAVAVSVWLTIHESRAHAREVAVLTQSLDDLRMRASREAALAQGRDRLTQDRLAALLQGNESLQTRLAPFQRAAARLFPSLPPPSALSELEKRLAGLSGRTQALESRLQPRSLHPSARQNFRMLLAPYAGQVIRIDGFAGDAEIAQFARQLFDWLRDAGLSVPQLPNAIMTPDAWTGLVLQVPSSAPQGFGEAVASALRLAGHSTRVVPVPTEPLVVLVGAQK